MIQIRIQRYNAMTKKQIYEYLKEKSIPYKAVEHEAVFTVEQARSLNLPNPEAGAKNLFLCDAPKRNFYLLTVRDTLPVRINEFREKIGSKRLSFASEEDLFRIMNLMKGSVTPFGVINDDACIVKVYFDNFFKGKIISVHPNDNTATVYLKCDDLVNLIHEHGNPVEYFHFLNTSPKRYQNQMLFSHTKALR